MRAFSTLLFLTISVLPLSGAETSRVLPERPLQGDTVVVSFPKGGVPVRGSFDGEPVSLITYRGAHRAVFGIPASKKPGAYSLRVAFADGSELERTVSVRARKFPRVVLGIPEKLNLTAQALTLKLGEEKKNIEAALEERTDETLFTEPFGLPLYDNRRIGSPYGEIRVTGGTEIRHLGVDFGARKGAHVGAMNAGVVRKAYVDTVYGNSVIMDHGEGISSLYLHLDEMRVKEGERVKKGTVIGTVGETGYATSPHLHLSVKIGKISVDPLRFVERMR